MLPASLDGERFDRALAAAVDGSALSGTSRATLSRWIKEGRVECDGVVASATAKARSGMRVRIVPAPPPPSSALPQAIALDVLYEDEHLVVLDKRAGMVVHPAPGHPDGTLVNAFLHRFGETGADPVRPGIVHRLDKDTSGVMVVARSGPVRESLSALFAKHDLDREYVALAEGEHPPEATYDTLHGRHRVDRKRFTTHVTRGKRALTHVRAEERLHGATLVRCRLETGRTHQIRVHLCEHGHAIVGDPIYGRTSKDARVREVAAALGRQALHAGVLGFVHPITRAHLRFESPVPPDMRAAIDALREGPA